MSDPQWTAVCRVELEFECPEDEALTRSRELQADLEEVLGLRVRVTTARSWLVDDLEKGA